MTNDPKNPDLANSEDQIAIPYQTLEEMQKSWDKQIQSQVRKEEIREAVSDTADKLQKTFATKDALKGYVSYPWFIGIVSSIFLLLVGLYWYVTPLLVENISRTQYEKAFEIRQTVSNK